VVVVALHCPVVCLIKNRLMSDADQAAAAAAAEEAFHKFAVESWTLYGIGLFATMLRTYARIRAVGIRNLRPDDYLAWVGMVRETST